MRTKKLLKLFEGEGLFGVEAHTPGPRLGWGGRGGVPSFGLNGM